MNRLGAMGRVILGVMALAPGVAFGQREVQDFNRDWRFIKGEQPEAARQLTFDDSGWQAVRLPHDWAIAGPFQPNGSGNTGKLPWQGVGWYRKTFTSNAAAGQRVYFDFDGVMAFPKVYVNGQLAGEWNYGYMSFRVDATPFIRYGERNVIAVQVDTRRHQSRWYPGAGIYRKVTMTVNNPVHIAHWGAFVTTPAVADARATVRVQTSVDNHRAVEQNVTLGVTVLDQSGKQVASASKDFASPANGTVTIDQQLLVANPQRWDLTRPNLYTAVVTLRSGDLPLDRETVPFGIRTFRFTANDGYYLNGKRVQLHGVCLHSDLGALGMAFNLRAMERELQIMKDMGVNAIRTSHNPPAPELLDLCDRMGLFVWDEAFDKWNATGDNVDGVAGVLPNAQRQITGMVQRDRNHPSVMVWSVGNEIATSVNESGEGMSFGRLAAMREMVLKQDATRPVGIACHTPDTVAQAVYDPLDLTGWNYGHRYDRYHEMYPDKPILYSESASAVSTRGYFAFPIPAAKGDFPGGTNMVSAYDLNAPSYSDIADVEFALMEKDKFVGGEFVWTGFDYLGEPTPSREARSSYFGIVDLAGIPKDRYYLYRSYWSPNENTIHILPHWNWPDRVGKNVPVMVYTNGDSAELFLNGKSLGRRTKGVVPKPRNVAEYYDVTYKYRLRWDDVTYEPGELKAVAYKGTSKIGEQVMRTAGPPAAIRLTPDRTVLAATGEDLSYVLVEALDARGNPAPLADNLVQFEVQGPGEIAGIDNGDPTSYESFQAPQHKLFFGKAMLIVRTKEGQAGSIQVTAGAQGLKAGTAALTASR